MVTFYTLLQHEKSKWLFNIHEKKNYSRVIVIGIFKENQLKDIYVTNKMQKV